MGAELSRLPTRWGHYQLQQHGAEIMERSVKYCLIQLFEEMAGSFGEAILNDRLFSFDTGQTASTGTKILPLYVLFRFVTSASAPAP